MTIQPEHPNKIYQQVIRFANNNHAQAVFLPLNIHPRSILSHLALPTPEAVIIIAGGASLLSPQLHAALRSLFTDGIARLAATLNALVIDGGTQSGVMELLGQGIAAQPQTTHNPTLLGIAPAGTVSYPGQSSPSMHPDQAPLDANHPHFVLVDTDTWGGETATMYELARLLTRQRPSVAIAINGGAITQTEILYNVRQRRPIVVLSGSGRVADTVAHLWQTRPASIPDPELAEIIHDGDIHLFPYTNPATELVQLLQHILAN